MKHVHITLVGGSPTPVYQGITHLQPDQIVLICSQQSKDFAYKVKAELDGYTEGNVFIYEVRSITTAGIYELAETIEKSLSEDIVLSLNLSGGMKLWTAVFNEVFGNKRPDCQRFIIGQSGEFYDLTNKGMSEKVHFDMEAQFRLLGHEINSSKLLSDYTPKDFSVLRVVYKLGTRYQTHKDFFDITKCFLEKYNEKYCNLLYKESFSVERNGNILEWIPEEQKFICQLSGEEEYILSSPNVTSIVLNTGWFELYVAKMIAKKYDAKNIRLNCVFKNSRNLTKNEVDIIVNTGNKLIFVECKTQVAESTDVDKFHSVVKNFGGLGSKHLFVTNWEMKSDAKEKCDDYGITTFHCITKGHYCTYDDRVMSLCLVLEQLDKDWNI